MDEREGDKLLSTVSSVSVNIRTSGSCRIISIPCPVEAVQKCSTIRDVLSMTDSGIAEDGHQIVEIPDNIGIDAVALRKVFSWYQSGLRSSVQDSCSDRMLWALSHAQLPRHDFLMASEVERGILRIYAVYCAADYLGCDEVVSILTEALNKICENICNMPAGVFYRFLVDEDDQKPRLVFNPALLCGIQIVRKVLELCLTTMVPGSVHIKWNKFEFAA